MQSQNVPPLSNDGVVHQIKIERRGEWAWSLTDEDAYLLERDLRHCVTSFFPIPR